MAHARETLLDALVAQIIAAATGVGSRVYRGRHVNVQFDEFPVCVVYQGAEASEFNDAGAAFLKFRDLNVAVELHDKDTPALLVSPDIESNLNALSLEVENALESDITFGGTCLMFQHIGTDTELIDAEVDRGVLRLSLLVRYRTQLADAAVLG